MNSLRMWTVPLPAGMALLNANRRHHHHTRARLTRELRGTALVYTKAARVPHLERAHIVVEYRPPDKRRRDVHNLFPSAKAAVDGVVDAGVLTDDSDAYLIGPDMRLGAVEPLGRLVIHITELGAS